MSVTSGVGLVSQMEKFGRIIAGSSYANYLLLKKNDFAYNKSATKEYPEGYIALYSGDELAAVPNSIFTCFRIRGESPVPQYLNHLFLGNLHGKWLRKFIEVGARAHGSLSINDGDLLALPVPLPSGKTSVAEQQKIAECLGSVDELMAAQARKVDALKTHKNGLMQQLFPREGETQPSLRFPEFQNAGEWKIKNLNQLLFEAKTRNRTLELGPAEVLSVSGEHGCVNQIEHLGRSYAGASVRDYHVVEHGDIVYTKSPLKRNPFGIMKENKGKRGIVSTLYAVYRAFPNCSASYLDQFFSVAYNLNVYLQPIVKKGAKNDMKVNNADVLRGEICVPEFEEQRKIAECLSSMDAKITAETQKLEALKIHKKGLMQQLFPSRRRLKHERDALRGLEQLGCRLPTPTRGQEVRSPLCLQRDGQDAALHGLQGQGKACRAPRYPLL